LAVIIKGTSCAGAGRLAIHLTRTDTNERAEVKELRGVAAESLRDALHEMEALAAGTRSTKPFYHASINTEPGERLTAAQWVYSIDKLAARLGLTDQPRAVVMHEKHGREHCHIAWSRIDLEKMRAISDSHNFRKHEEVARQLEREFGLKRVQGAHVDRDGKERPKRTPSHAEMLQAERTGISPKEVKERVTAIWQRTDNGPDFAKALWDAGFVLARGDRRDFVLIDHNGGTHSLARRIEGARMADIRERLADVDPKRFPNVRDAKAIQRERWSGPMPAYDQIRYDDALATAAIAKAQAEEKAKAKVRADDGMDWTQKGGMVEQQRSAMDWVKEAHEGRKARTEQTDRKQEVSETQQTRMDQHQALLREFGSEIENERDDERDFGRERGRSR
jgi:hypothetical protein